MTHPGLDSAALGKAFSWQYHWREELDAYLDAGNKALLKELGLEPVSFAAL